MTAVVVHQDEPMAASEAIVAPVEGAGERLSHVAPVPPPSVRRASSRSANRKPKDPHANRPENTQWAQQKLPMWEPVLTLSWTIGICFFVAATCLALGIAIVLTSSALTTVRVVYDGGSDTNSSDRQEAVVHQQHSDVVNLTNCLLDTPAMANSFHANHTCYVTITLPEAIASPAHVYYELTGFHQHHRRFVSSLDRTQFTDEWREGIPITMCAPLEKLESELCTVGVCDAASKRERKVFPCGIVANTMFNDIFWLHEGVLPNSTATLGRTDLVSKGVARTYPSHNAKNPTWTMNVAEYLPVWLNPNFSRIIAPVSGDMTPHITSDYSNSTAWVHDPLDPTVGVGTGVENEHWRVWVDGAATQPFRKAYGRIERDLPAGTKLVFAVQSNFFVRSFGGSKALVVSELSWIGSENVALGIFYLAVGSVFGVAGVLFAVRKCTNPRPLGDTTYLDWKHRSIATKKAQ